MTQKTEIQQSLDRLIDSKMSIRQLIKKHKEEHRLWMVILKDDRRSTSAIIWIYLYAICIPVRTALFIFEKVGIKPISE
jgi:hypothetical protein